MYIFLYLVIILLGDNTITPLNKADVRLRDEVMIVGLDYDMK